MARSRRADWHRKGPLLGVNRTKSPRARIDEIDHTRHNVCSGSWSRENAVAWRSEWIIFSIANFAANIVMRDGFRSIWEKQFQSFPSLRGFHTARVRLGADCDPPTAGLPSAAKARVHGGHRRCVADADILSRCSCSGLTNNDNLPLLRYSANRSIHR